MKFLKQLLPVLFVLMLSCIHVAAQKSSLPHSTPEAEGVSSQGIIDFIDAANKSKTEFHSFMLLRHGKVIAEGWWNPYRAGLRHSLYSCSKSFTATAVGFALAEKKLSLNDKVVSFFPNELPDTVSNYLKELTVKDVLMMSDGMEPDPSFKVSAVDSDWVKGFLATPIVHEPGTTFLYNSLGTYMLSAIVQKITGEKVMDYLQPRFFEPLGIRGDDWETDTKGINTGGWGLRVKTEDMAKFAELFLQNGVWNGKQILPKGWVEEASTAKIIQHPDLLQSKKDSSDWEQGYCYQMWRCRHNAYRGDGAFGQFMIVMPDEDVALAITAETADMQDELNLVWKYLLPAMHKGKLNADAKKTALLQQKIKALSVLLPVKNSSKMEQAISGKTYAIEQNNKHLQNIGFNFRTDICHVTLKTDTASYQFSFAAGKWKEGTTNKPGPSLTGAAIEITNMLYPAKVEGSYTWKDDNTLQLVLRYIESPHTEYITCHFDGNMLGFSDENSFDYGKNKLVMKASMQ
ncbi:MAG: beta-lactamase family protein [Bacteroidota bacterium]|nr:beta-lactamase family protein [Bacteroidota bacterium]